MDSDTVLNINDRTSSLDDIYFPSISICNINPLRKSFIYWLKEELRNSGQHVTVTELLNIIGNLYFSADADDETTEKHIQMLDEVMESKFFQEKFREFMEEKINGSDFSISHKSNKLYIYSKLEDAGDRLGAYNNITKMTYHKNYLRELASQWRQGQMIPYMKWNGMDPDAQNSDTGGVFLEIGYSTSFGLCSFITPYYRNMPPDSDNMTLNLLAKGALNGENNGLSLLLDAETFDYGNAFADIGERSGVGFKVAVVHHLDTVNMESNGIQLNVGNGSPWVALTLIF